MSNIPIDMEENDKITANLREDDLLAANTTPAKFAFVKPTVHAAPGEPALTAQQVIAISQLVEQKTRESIANSKYDARMSGQVINKSKVPVTDFSKMTLDDVYDLSIQIEAKPFMSADVLKIDLKDSNYEARWVNKNPQNLGDKIAKGFTYISDNDLVSSDAIQTSLDAQGHYCFNDVVAMKIDKATYYRALRAAHERAMATTDQATARQRAANQANGFMQRESGYSQDYSSAAANKKMVFYDPDISI